MPISNSDEPDPFLPLLALQYGLRISEKADGGGRERRQRMRTVLTDKTADAREAIPTLTEFEDLDVETLRRFLPHPSADRIAALAGLTQTDPFAPHVLYRDQDVHYEALRCVAADIQVSAADAEAVIKAWREVDFYLSAPGYEHLALGGLAAAALLATTVATGGLALGGLGIIGGASGFTAGLAAIGGSMAGGLFVIEVGAAAAAVTSAEAFRHVLRVAPPEQLEIEVRKSLITVTAQRFPDELAGTVTADLDVLKTETQQRVKDLEDRNDPGAPIFKALAHLLVVADRAVKWIDSRGHMPTAAHVNKITKDVIEGVGWLDDQVTNFLRGLF